MVRVRVRVLVRDMLRAAVRVTVLVRIKDLGSGEGEGWLSPRAAPARCAAHAAPARSGSHSPKLAAAPASSKRRYSTRADVA